MDRTTVIEFPAGAVTAEMIAGIKAATIGAAFAIPLSDGTRAILALAAVQTAGPAGGMPPHGSVAVKYPSQGFISKREKKRLSRDAHFVEITKKIQSGEARSVDAAALQLEFGPGGTHANQANYTARQYRKRFCIPASAFSRNKKENSEDGNVTACCNNASKLENRKENRMHEAETAALAPGTLQRIIPRRWLIDLRDEGMGDATTDEILSPDFWQEAKPILRNADIVSLIRGDNSVLDVMLMLYPNGELQVADLAATGHHVPPHPDLAGKLANKEATNAAEPR